MHQRVNGDNNGFLITVFQAAALINSGTATARRLAEESGAVRRIGRNYRINKQIYLDYIEQMHAE